jgi:IPT/TIG domain/PQQ-like domain
MSQPLSGDGTIVARVLNVTGMRSGTSAEAGVMIRETLSANSTNAIAAYRTSTPTGELLWRATTGSSTSFANSSTIVLPYWLKMARTGSVFTASISPDGVAWTQVGLTQSISMTTNVYIGLAVSSDDTQNNTQVTATFDNVSVNSASSAAPIISSTEPTSGVPGYDVLISGSGFGTSQGNSVVTLNGSTPQINFWTNTSMSITIPTGATSGPLAVLVGPSMNASNPAKFEVLPPAMQDQDVGSVGVPGYSTYNNGVYTISAAGPQIYGTADGMHFVYQPITGDTTVVARVVSVAGMRSGTSAEAGVMIRETLNSNSTNGYASYRTASPLVEYLWRSATAGNTSFVNSGAISLPYWVKMVRSGNSFSAYISSSGGTWTQVGTTQTINMATNAYVGLALSSCDSNNNSLVTATFDNVSVTPTAAQRPVISDINPFSGPVGMSVTISGANFGVQGASTVTFNGVVAGPGVWSPSGILVPVPFGATSGNIVVSANGMTSNGMPFSVISAPSISNLSPPSGPVTTQVTITGTNFGLSQGSSTVKFAGVTASSVTTWNPTTIIANVPNAATSGGVVVTVAGAASNPQLFTVTSTAPTISNLSPASGPTTTPVIISGSNFGSSPGTVTFNGTPASIGTWTTTSISTTVPPGATTGPVLVSVGGSASNTPTFTVYTIQSGSPSLFVHPNKMNMVVGQTQAIQLLDQNGTPFSSPTWSIGNPSLAAIIPPVNQGDPTLLQANVIGTTTLTGTSPDGRTGTAQVSILSGTSLPIGTVQWEIPSLGNSTPGITNMVQTLRIDDTTPDFYVFDSAANGGSGAFRALTATGQQKWMFTPSAPGGEELALLAADDQGGFIYTRDDSSDRLMVGRVDENGNQSWLVSTPGFASNVAIHPDGTIYFVQQDYLNTGSSPTAVMALDGATGQLKFTIPLPSSSSSSTDISNLNDPAGGPGGDGYPLLAPYCTPGTSSAPSTFPTNYGSLTISSGGIVYLPIGPGTSTYHAMPCDSSPDPLHPGFPHLVKTTDGNVTESSNLQVLAINSDGSYSFRQLDSISSTETGDFAGPGGLFFDGSLGVTLGGATPDGNGGTLVAVNSAYWASSVPSAFYHDTGSAVAKLNLTAGPKGDVLIGEDGTAYLSGTTGTSGAITAINTSTNTIKWTDPLSTNLLPLISVPASGGVIFEDYAGHLNLTDPNGVISPLFPASNGTDAGPLNTSSTSYWTLGTWLASLSDGGVGPIAGNNMFLAASERPELGGSEKKDGKPHIPQIVSYLPSQIESQPAPADNVTTINYPCFMDSRIWNSARNYKQNSCSSTFQQQETNNNTASQIYRLTSQALVRTFRTDLGSKLDALAFLGHATERNNNPAFTEYAFTVGILFYYPVYPGLTPGDGNSWDWFYTAPWQPVGIGPFGECPAPNNLCGNPNSTNYLNKLLPFEKDSTTVTGLGAAWAYNNSAVIVGTPAPGEPPPALTPRAPVLLANKLSQQAKVLFIGACAVVPKMTQPGDLPVFMQMWDIVDAGFGNGSPESEDRAMIVPDGNSIPNEIFDTNATDLSYAAFMWQQILYDMIVKKMTVYDAVADANTSITPNWPVVNGVQQPNFMVLGNKNVRLH